MKAFPNPTANNLNIQYTLDKEQTALINITNTEGKSIVKRKIINAKIINEIFFLNRLPSGIYTIELNFETGKICQQLFKL